MEKEIVKILQYFARFSYPASLEEILMFFPLKATSGKLAVRLQEMVAKRSIIVKKIKDKPRYTIPLYSICYDEYITRTSCSQLKLKKIFTYVMWLSFFSQIKLVGLSGSLAMNNAKKEDDIDFFLITAKNRLWTARFIALILAHFMGIRRPRGVGQAKDKVCLNLFFDASDLKIPKFKQTNFVAHELLQMKPLIAKNGIYKKLLKSNSWVFDIFPNSFDLFRDSKKVRSSAFGVRRSKNKINLPGVKFIGDFFERILKTLQKIYIRRHQTTEFITQKQLWFFPEDFEKKVGKNA